MITCTVTYILTMSGAIIREVIAENPADGVDGAGVDKLCSVIRSIIPGSSFKVSHLVLQLNQKVMMTMNDKTGVESLDWTDLHGEETYTSFNLIVYTVIHTRHSAATERVHRELQKQLL